MRALFGATMLGLLTGRNETMVRNIVKSVDEDPALERLLVIVGKAHVRGMRRLLVREHGYRPISLPKR